MRVIPGVHWFKLPLEGVDLRWVNIYLLEGPKGSLVVDTGWNVPGVWEEMLKQFAAEGLRGQDVAAVLPTHAHADHFGLAARFKELSGAKVMMHPLGESLIRETHTDVDPMLESMDRWLTENGATDSEVSKLRQIAGGWKDKAIPIQHADRRLLDGDVVSNGAFDLKAVWTPGHSPDHICFYEPKRKLLFTGDHILPDITPWIGLNPQNSGNPLKDFLNSLLKVRDLPVDLVLPAHGDVFTELQPRVDQLLHHHEDRGAEILGVLDCQPRTARDIATRITWLKDLGGWPYDKLRLFDRRLALMECLSHLELLLSENKAAKMPRDGHVAYLRASC